MRQGDMPRQNFGMPGPTPRRHLLMYMCNALVDGDALLLLPIFITCGPNFAWRKFDARGFQFDTFRCFPRMAMSNALSFLRELAEAERLHRMEEYEPRIVPYGYAGLPKRSPVVPTTPGPVPELWIEPDEVGEPLADRAR
jgi:hypothetical protein